MNANHFPPIAALSAMGFALVVALVARPPEAEPNAWAAAVEAGEDHISATALAERLLADPGAVLLVDVRPADEYAAFHLPGAINLDLVELLGKPGDELLAAHPGGLVVLYSNGMTHPAQAWVELSRRGRTDVRVLEDGIDGFVRELLTPPSLRGVTTEERAKRQQPGFAAATAAFLTRPVAEGRAQQEPARVEAPAFARLATDPAALTRPTIVSTAWVANRGSALVVLDARDKPEEFAAGHVPSARHVPIASMRGEREGVPDQLLAPERLASLLGQLGIDAETDVVAYGGAKLQDPAHLALALISVGHQKVAILEGGWPAWKAEGRPESLEVPSPAAKTYGVRPAPGFRAVVLEDVVRASAGSSPRILDVRPADAFRGDVSTEARGGHIPRSWNRPYTSDVATTDAGPFWRPIEDLRAEYAALGFGPKEPTIVSCRTGHQAAQTWFTLRYVLGYEDVRWYDGSWKEWAARSELPVETGPARK